MAEIDPAASVVCDAGPLIHLDELGVRDLLTDFHKVVIPGRVWAEVEHHRPEALAAPLPNFQRRELEVSTAPHFRALVEALALDAGEQEALSCPELTVAGVLLTDDTAARLAAEALGYRAHGTVGVLLRAIRRGLRSAGEVLALLEEIPSRSTLHIRPRLLQLVIDEVKGRRT